VWKGYQYLICSPLLACVPPRLPPWLVRLIPRGFPFLCSFGNQLWRFLYPFPPIVTMEYSFASCAGNVSVPVLSRHLDTQFCDCLLAKLVICAHPPSLLFESSTHDYTQIDGTICCYGFLSLLSHFSNKQFFSLLRVRQIGNDIDILVKVPSSRRLPNCPRLLGPLGAGYHKSFSSEGCLRIRPVYPSSIECICNSSL